MPPIFYKNILLYALVPILAILFHKITFFPLNNIIDYLIHLHQHFHTLLYK